MKQLKWILLGATILTLGACSSDGELQEQVYAEVELRLSSSLDQRTRAAYTKTQDTQILSGENVYAWVDEAKSDGAVEYIQAWQLTADGSGNFSAAQKTYPISGNPINVYAVHGNFSTGPSGSFPTAALSHHVNVVQNTSAGYAASDLLYATGTNLARQTAAHQLTFRHLLSKIEVYLVAGIGTTKHSSSSGFDSGWGGTASMRSRIIVAGGGAYTSYDGPTLYAPYTYVKKGGCAGGLVGYDGRDGPYDNYCGKGGTQTSGGASPSLYYNTGVGDPGQFGYGGAGKESGQNGGGSGGSGGWYGGSGASGAGGGSFGAGGGSSFISGHPYCNGINSSGTHQGASKPSKVRYQGTGSEHTITFTSTVIIDGGGYAWTSSSRGKATQMPKPDGGYYASGFGHPGNGYAKITSE